MYTLLCRIMVIVFLVNCLTPATGWGQERRRTRKQSFDAQLERQVTQAESQNTPALQFFRADRQIRQAHQDVFAAADVAAKERKRMQQNPPVVVDFTLPQDKTYVAAQKPMLQSPNTAKSLPEFLKKVRNNELEFKDLIEYADPMDPTPGGNNLSTTAYAAEVIGNSVDEAAQLDPALYDISELQSLLPQVEARLLYRLALLGNEAPSYTSNKTKEPASISKAILRTELSNANALDQIHARGAIRLALLKIHHFYQTKQLPDPADEYQKQALAQQMQESLRPHLPSADILERGSSLAAPKMGQKAALKKAAIGVDKYGNIASFQRDFLNELKNRKDRDPKESSANFFHLQVIADYAVAYALEHNPDGLKDIVAIFDEGVKKQKFQQKYAPVLNAIFTSVFENTRYSAMGEKKTQKVLSLLAEFSNPEKYSLPTRVFALEAAGLLYRPFNAQTIQGNQNQPPFAVFAPLNLNKPDENLRRTFAWRVSELYCPLVSTNDRTMETYGLDAGQMQELANKLAYIYDGFYDIHTALFEDAATSTHMRDDFPAKCYIVMHNEPNKLKSQQETTSAILSFTAETLFWVYGGEVFSLLGTAFRLTRGAIVALPKAGKAYTLAARGEKIAAFNKQLQQGAKFANWVYKNKKQQGYIVELAVQGDTKAVVSANQAGVSIPSKYVRINHTYQLEGTYSHWNPKRWLGLNREQNIVGMRVTRYRPNFNTQVAEATFDTPISGFHSMQDIEKAWSQLRLVTDPTKPMLYETKPYFSAIWDFRQAQMEQSLLQGLEKSFYNSMDVFAPVTDLPPAYEFMAGSTLKGFRAWTAEEIAAHTKWWNITRWGNPYESVTDLKNMPIFIAARSRAIPNVPVAGGIELPASLPGFRSTMGDFVSGNWHKQAFNAFFRPMNWSANPTSSRLITNHGPWGRRIRQVKQALQRTFLPDYLPTQTFWATAKESPRFAAQMFPRLLWRNRFVGTSAFFGTWMGADHILYPPYQNWLEGEATKDTQAEINKYGDTFSEKQAKMDEILMQKLGMDTSDQRAMTTYQAVTQAQEEQKDGTLITAPIIGVRRILGAELIDDATKANYAHQANRVTFNRARLQQMHQVLEQSKTIEKENEKAVRAFKASVEEAYNQQVAIYPLGFAALPQAKKQLKKLFDQYTQDMLAAKTEREQNQIDDRFIQQRNQILLPVDVWEVVLQDAEQIIQNAKLTYTQDSNLVTPAIERQIRTVYKEYAKAYVRTALPIQDPAQQQTKGLELLMKRNQELGVIWADLYRQWSARHPEATAPAQDLPASMDEEPEYGTNWDENAAN